MDTAVPARSSVGREHSLNKRRRASRTAVAGSLGERSRAPRASGNWSTQPPLDREEAGARALLPRLSTTFTVPEVESAFISFCQLASHAPCSESDLEARRRELLRQVTNHVRLPEFDSPQADHEICGRTLLEPLESEFGIEHGFDARSIYAKLCATRVLTVSEERSVMRRMHYLKYLAFQILSRDTLSQWDLTRAHGLAKAAMWHRDLMMQANMRLVVSVVKRLPVEPGCLEEMISDGAVALLRAVDKFDPARGFRFCTYATTVIRRECYLHIKMRRQDKSQRTQTAGPTVMSVVCANSKTLSGLDGDGAVGIDRAHWLAWRERLAGMMSVLTRREQVIIRSRYCLGSHRRVKTLKRLSVALKISKERVRQIEIGALAKLRAAAAMPM